MSLASDLKILYHMALRPVRGKTHAERLEGFYGGQAKGYDDFRKRLLHGREELYQKLPTPEGGVWVEMGGGTASNLQDLGERIARLSDVVVVDLSPSLLKVAAERAAHNGWKNVRTLEADVTTIAKPKADVITFSYSLTMIPDWFAALDNALVLLKPGGVIGIVDFYVSRKYPSDGLAKHPWRTRHFWPTWFASDNVHPSPDHLPYLQHRFKTLHLSEHRGKVPYLPLVRAPYYLFIGQKTAPVPTSVGTGE
jgi:S-adenosylmethionine-diacylgycerolhomoserine-N-methlytransferase